MSSEQLLDNLAEACDSMMTMLDEGAYRRYMQNVSDKQSDLAKQHNYNRQVADATSSSKAKDIYSAKAEKNAEDFRKLSKDNEKYLPMHGRVTHDPNKSVGNDMDDYEKFMKRSVEKGNALGHEAKDRWNKDHGDTGEDKLAARKPGTIKAFQDKKKAIKETCLYILSILDEI